MRSTFMSTRRSRRLVAALVVAVAAATAGAAALTQPADATVTTLKTFTTPGIYTWTVPTGVTNVTFTVYGASGGGAYYLNHNIRTYVSHGGAGGEAKARFAVHAGEVFEIIVGGQGGDADEGGTTTGAPGFPNGGTGSETSNFSGGGGGASDVRIGGRGNTCANIAPPQCGSDDRIIVGGGGGGGANYSAGAESGQPGGGVVGGGANTSNLFGGTQETWGHCAAYGIAGFGLGATPLVSSGDGGGGGGWWGGGCDNSFALGGNGGGGGGGSGFISPLAQSGAFPTTTNTGNGKVNITTTT